MARLTASVIVVMFAPNAMQSGSPAPTKSASARCPSARIASLARLTSNTPPCWEFVSREIPAPASATQIGALAARRAVKKATGRPF